MSIQAKTTVKDGKVITSWVVNVVGPDGKRHRKTFDNSADAARYHDAMQNGPEKCGLSVGAICDRYGTRSRLQPSTANNLCYLFNKYVKPVIGEAPVSNLTASHFRALASETARRGASPGTTYHVLTGLAGAISYAEAWGLVKPGTSGILRPIARHYRPPPNPQHDFPTHAEFRTMVESAPDMWPALIMTLGFVGCPLEALRKLTWDDVDLNRHLIRYLVKSPRVSGEKRTMPLPPKTVEALRRWRAVQPANHANLVFPGPSGGIISSLSLRAGFERVQITSGATQDISSSPHSTSSRVVCPLKSGPP